MQQSSLFQDGAFVNVERQAPTEITWEFLKEQFFGEQKREPDGVIPVVPVAADVFTGPASQALKATWFGHATVLVELEGKRVFVDPVFSERVSPVTYVGPKRLHPVPIDLAKVANVDAVVISHNHYDHLDEATTRHLAAGGTHFYVPLGVGIHFDAWGIASEQVHEMAWWQEAEIGNLKIIATPSRHYSGRGLLDYKRTQWASWALVGQQERAFYSGDSGYSKLFAEIGEKLGPFDLNMIKIGAYGPTQAWLDIHMTAENAVRTHQDLRGKKLLPVHWATFNLAIHDWDEPIRRTIKAAQESNSTLLTPKVGQPVLSGAAFTNEAWWVGVK
ncbi:MAG: MBL fold metallo-hydrolase [Rhizobiaceae bacterium]|nr:MBL fold metallo-hydrolase [Hyphomicrobiales bacterium]NRB30858.1 MBL fold metallo-hydrolase [Rhizobiaceae bacterium]